MNKPTALEPIELHDAHKSDVRTQFGALCYRIVRGKPEVLLVTSRGTKRWIVPKGWPMDGKTPAQSAAIEAWEEAGVRGRMYDRCLGLYSYRKTVEDGEDLPCVTMLYAMKVNEIATEYPEAHERRRKWLRPKKAAAMVDEADLAHLIRNFDPAHAKY
ncbi:NUDIX hydrolase [Roseovarius sp. S4756]|uniref:NUDIX hydrolase n=1 Tax=Roseovarius maritimus TaxID=3342637 RepID=UPI003728E6D7